MRTFLGDIRDVAGLQMGKAKVRPNNRIVNAALQLGDSRQVDCNVQILLDVLDERNHRMAKVALR